MRRSISWLAVGVLVSAPALCSFGVGSARAATMGFEAELSFQIATLDPIVVTGSGVATVNGASGPGHLDSLALPGTVLVGGQFLEVTDPAASPIAAVSATAMNGAGTFVASTPGSAGTVFGGPMGLPGQARVCLFVSECNAGVVLVPFTSQGAGVGLGGSPTPHVTVAAAIEISVTGAGWTVNAVTAQSGPIDGPFTTSTRTGFAHGPASGGLSTAGTPNGVVQLVTPIQIETNIGPSGALPAFAVLTVRLVPEPAVVLLSGAAIVTLALVGRRQLRARKR
jgi:hypothetical protein